MNQTLKELITSKKFIAAVCAVIIAIGAHYGLNLDAETVSLIIAPLIAYVVGQGMADKGKGAAAITALAEISPSDAKRAITKKGEK